MENLKDTLWVEMVDLGIATEEELQLATSLNGYTIKTLKDVLQIRTGYRSLEQYFDYEANKFRYYTTA